ncbi:hypothetical protein CDAR_304711 [Caerostris darwini]|uniref:Uncharacterized protein n=1 Tax=Caerostris darwini TaxID=1538125 RepID=A0AAV4PSX8_9ARAC|nr:hypothetical protein CDAR_304711 [Caerostris darwini]
MEYVNNTSSLETNEVIYRSNASQNPTKKVVSCGTQTTGDIPVASIVRCVSCTVISTLKSDDNNIKL